MKKTLLSLALIAASGTAVAGDYYNGRLTGMSGAGYATGGYADGVIYNPSLGANFKSGDRFALVLNGGALLEEEDDLLDGLEDLADYLESLEQRTAADFAGDIEFDPNDPNRDDIEQQLEALQQEEADEAKRRLEGVANKTANVGAGGSFVLSIPNDWLAMSLVGTARVEAAVTSLVDENDFQLIDDAVGQTNFDADQLQSSGIAKGALVGELGLAMAKSLKTGEDSRLLVGVTPKYVRVTSFIYETDVDDFDRDAFDADQYTVDSTDYNVDIGATYISGNMHYALTVSNVFAREYATVDPAETLEIRARPTTAIGYKNSWFTAEAAVDLRSSPSFSTGRDTQFARVGVELNGWNWVQVRAGVQHDLEDNLEDTYSVGVGFSPFNVVNLDIAGFKGDNNAIGGAVQLGLRF